MSARPPGEKPPPPSGESSFSDETVPPQKSPLRGALPFGAGRPAPPPPPAPPRPAPRPSPSAPTGDETAPPQRSPLAAALPFRHAKPSPLETARTVAFLMPPDPGAAPASPAHQNTHSPQPARSTPPSHAPPPAGGGPVPASSTGHFGLSIEQYAALCAEVAVFPQAAEATFAKHGLAARKDRLTADLAWQERLRDDPALMQRWQGLYLHYHEHYSRMSKR